MPRCVLPCYVFLSMPSCVLHVLLHPPIHHSVSLLLKTHLCSIFTSPLCSTPVSFHVPSPYCISYVPPCPPMYRPTSYSSSWVSSLLCRSRKRRSSRSEEDQMDECAAAMVLMKLSCSPRSPVLPDGEYSTHSYSLVPFLFKSRPHRGERGSGREIQSMK